MNTKKEKLLYATYQSFMDQGLGRIKPGTLKDILADEVMGFGTTADEKIFGIKAFLKLLRIQKEQSEGLDMMWKIEPVSRYVNAEENLAAFADDIHLNIDADGEKIEMYLRFSIILEYTINKWLVIHWHGSKPEDVQSEEDTFGIENWKQKVEKLEIIVAERTADLVEKNRKLEIETSLERVRARSMAMHNTSELQAVIHTVHNELLHLNIAIDGGSFIAINSDIESELRCWGSGGTAETTEEVHIPLYKKPFCTNLINRIKKGPGFFTEEYTQKEKKDFFTFLFKHQPWSKLNAKQKKETLSSPGGYTRSCCVSKHTCIFIINHLGVIFSADDNEILQRFGKVFEQAYTRFLDLQKAEAQAREAEIELSLERVRARTMAMQHSDELLGTSKVVFDQLKNLGETAHQLSIGIVNEKDAVFDVFATIFGDQMIQVYHSKIDDPFVMGKVYKAWKVHQKSFVIKIKGKRLREYNITRNSIVKGMKVYPEIIQPDDCWIVSCATFSAGIIAFSSDKEITNESFQLLERFAKVFEQTYTRFLDLQKAEAQVREAEIELALERVRARTLAMQYSEELQDAAIILFQQLKNLNVETGSCGFNIWDKSEKQTMVWMSSPEGGIQLPFRLPHTQSEIYKEAWAAMEAGADFFVKEVQGNVLKKHFDYLSTLPGIGDVINKLRKINYAFPEKMIYHFAFFKQGYLSFHTHEKVPEVHDIFKRFAKVFEQTYTRFLDLQKAEAQAKEAKIEAALEKVRSRSLAMHKADELGEVVLVIVEKIKELNIEMNGGVTLVTFEPGSKDFLEWHSNPGQIGETLTGLLSYFDHPVFNDCIKAIEQGVELLAKVYPKAEKDSYIDYLAAHTDYIPGDMVEWVHEQQYMGFSFAIQKHSGIFLQDYTDKFFSKEENDILIRFSRVFEQSYIRFLDLQKAEAQARESQIEAALEKVRSRSLAMHKTDELQEVVSVVLERMTDLNIELDTININIFKEDSHELNLWTAAPGQKYAVPFHLPFIAHPFHTDIFTAKENGLDFFTRTYSFEEKNSYFNYTFEHSDFKYVPKAKKKLIMEGRVCTRSMAITKNAGIIIIRYYEKPFSDSENEILKRFAKVFEQAYTRFLDLQKAEAQARESQIEAALEKIRSRSLAMHRSDELKDVIAIMFEKLNELNVLIGTVGIWLFNKAKMDSVFWVGNDLQQPSMVSLPYDGKLMEEDTNYRDSWQAWISGENYINKRYTSEQKNKYFNYVFANNNVEVIPAPVREIIMKAPVHIASLIVEKNSSLFFDSWQEQSYSEASIDVFKKVSKVFEQAYVRFLDLQKAEAQAKEAQIEAALEKVRSRSMGMQKSEELKEVIKVVYEQFVHLNINVEHTGFIMDYKTRDDMHIWLADQHLVPSEIFIPYFDSSHWNSFREAKEKGADFFPTLLDFEEKNKFYKDLFALIPGIPEETMDYYFSCPGLAGSTVLLDNVSLYIENFQGIPYTNEENNTLMRFGKVFQQTYTRFLDLQKAEAQAREAQIEAALERTRTQSMIMQHSNELNHTLRVFHEQVLQLNIPSAFSFLWLPDEEKNKHLFWAIWEENKNDAITFKDKAINYPLDRNEPATAQCLIDWKSGEPVYSYAVQPEGVENYFATWHELIDGVEKLKPEFFPVGLYYVEAFMKYGCFGVMVETDLIDEEKKILFRFAVEFERTYARFLDLQKAEAQAREAQIELGLERVRARAMAMQHSNELSQLVDTVFKELANLDFALNWCIINIIDEPSLTNIVWAANPETNKPPESYLMKFEDYPFHHSMMRGYQERKTKHVYVLEGKEKKEYDEYLFNKTEWRRVPKKAQAASRAMKSYVASFTFSNFGGLQTVGEEPLSEESLDILHRFGKVFDSTYTRFNDLQKAEAQAREAKIEAALERVRSRTMAMQRSDELPEAANLLFQQIQALGIPAWSAGYCIWEDNKKAITLWMSSEGVLQPPARAPLTEDPSFIHMREAYEKGESFHVEAIGGDELVQHYQYMRTLPVVGDMLDSIIEAGHPLPTFQIFHCVYFSQGFLLFITYEPVPDAHDIFKRFGKVFDQTYTRFLDLQKAEAQVREAQIEAGLERVRSRSMAMHSSDELVDTSDTLFVEVKKLGLDVIRTGVGIFNGQSDTLEIWSRFENNESNKRKILGIVTGAAHPQIDKWIKAWKSRLPYFSFTLVGEEVKEYYERMSSYLSYPTQIDYNAQETISAFFFPEGSLNIVSYNFLKEAECNIMIRFATVFGQVYQRFLDLQKAEAQARESQIEAALERVRSRMMSMHRSDELSETAAHLFAQLNQLGIKPYRCNIVIVDKAHDTCKIWATTNKGVVIPLFASFPLTETPSFAHMYDAWKNNEKRQVLKLIGEERVIHTKYISQFSTITEYMPGEVDFEKIANEAAVFSNFFFKQGFLFIHTLEEMSAANMNIIQRFTNVFEQTYTRFLDLQKAETQAREAQIEAALEKVRSRTLAMQNSDELADTSIVIFEQLIHLGIEPNRLFIGIINNETAAIEAWATNEDGTKIGNHFTLNTQKNESVKKMYEGWKENKTSITIDMTGEELQNYFHYLSNEMQIPFKGGLSQKRRIQTIAYFGQGLIGMASPEEQPEATTQLLERFAAVFNLTYTRFNDLKIAEAHALQAEEDLVKLQTEKRRAEDALTNLQAAQKQLVQSEKMASLGELTAGIAHEIQNPLNFVNNFSEVSKELLDEMKEEMEKGHLEDVKQIMQDVIQNLEKINHHGKRADGIVKGMLQHSQSSKGQKQPTDLNALCDEYLRLSYHGLRAKDKDFNAEMKTDFDNSIGKINIIPQDIGRVLLNLYNNAFYAAPLPPEGGFKNPDYKHQPTVWVSTKRDGHNVLISVKDNGPGIPQNIVDKIFQPFFTTKPTGQGTGLGLSLSYDIVKAHGGEIRVESRENEGTTLIIQLPFTKIYKA